MDLSKLEHLGSEYLRNSIEPIFLLEPFTAEGGYSLVESFRSRKLLGNLSYPDSTLNFLFPGLDLIGFFICDTHLLVEICLNELEGFPDGIEKDVIEFCDHRAHSQRLEQLPRSDWSHINRQREYFPIYCEDGYNYGKFFLLDTVDLLHCLIPKAYPHVCWGFTPMKRSAV